MLRHGDTVVNMFMYAIHPCRCHRLVLWWSPVLRGAIPLYPPPEDTEETGRVTNGVCDVTLQRYTRTALDSRAASTLLSCECLRAQYARHRMEHYRTPQVGVARGRGLYSCINLSRGDKDGTDVTDATINIYFVQSRVDDALTLYIK